MSTTPTPSNDGSRQSDMLLWVAAIAVAVMGGAWLFVSKPWASATTPEPTAAASAPTVVAMATPNQSADALDATTALDGTTAPDGAAAPDASAEMALDNPLRMAKLAYDAGMLVEPADYSAWTLYSRVSNSDPHNQAALDGLTQVADDLVRRGETALDQGRFDDARATVERIRAVLPKHAGAKELAEKIWPNATVARNPTAEKLKPQLAVQPPPPAVAPVTVEEKPAPPPKPAVDPIVEANKSFEEAMAASRLLTPSDEQRQALPRRDGGHQRQACADPQASRRLSAEFLSRASQSLEALDTEAAGIWIDEAQAVGSNPEGVAAARNALIDQQIAMESAKPVSASDLKVVTYVPPEYPERALERRIEGWVDIEFTVATDGTTPTSTSSTRRTRRTSSARPSRPWSSGVSSRACS